MLTTSTQSKAKVLLRFSTRDVATPLRFFNQPEKRNFYRMKKNSGVAVALAGFRCYR